MPKVWALQSEQSSSTYPVEAQQKITRLTNELEAEREFRQIQVTRPLAQLFRTRYPSDRENQYIIKNS